VRGSNCHCSPADRQRCKNDEPKQQEATVKKGINFHQYLDRVNDDLYQSSTTHIYYGTVERDGKQIRRSLKTNDLTLAQQRLQELRDADDPQKVAFANPKKSEEWTQTLTRVGDNLYRSNITGIYYALFQTEWPADPSEPEDQG